MSDPLREELLALEAEDMRVRAELAADGSLFDGYHPRMAAVHRQNAARLREIVERHGWPGCRLVGEDGAAAAWRIAQHAIGEPDFQRACLQHLAAAGAVDDAPAWQAAYLEDRIRVFEGRPQRYGTQFDVGDDGRLVPEPIEDADHVEERREAIGLEPLAVALARAERVEPPSPAVRAQRRHDYLAWLQSVGWRA